MAQAGREDKQAMKHFATQYRHNGRDYTMHFEAEDFEDAEARMRSAYFNGQVQEIVGRFPVPAFVGSFFRGD